MCELAAFSVECVGFIGADGQIREPMPAFATDHELMLADAARYGALRVRSAWPLSITFDHRAVMGAEAARFMASMSADLSAGV
jgi:pyruvate/2-oxoglutarate dehydrogenase complex dihydrolipoamide acyltransferase (E2) component